VERWIFFENEEKLIDYEDETSGRVTMKKAPQDELTSWSIEYLQLCFPDYVWQFLQIQEQ
jgi:hypothetical protein